MKKFAARFSYREELRMLVNLRILKILSLSESFNNFNGIKKSFYATANKESLSNWNFRQTERIYIKVRYCMSINIEIF